MDTPDDLLGSIQSLLMSGYLVVPMEQVMKRVLGPRGCLHHYFCIQVTRLVFKPVESHPLIV